MAIVLKIIDEFADINNKLATNIGSYYSLGEEHGILLIEEAKASSGLLVGTSICRENGETFAPVTKIRKSGPSIKSCRVEKLLTDTPSCPVISGCHEGPAGLIAT